MNHAGGGVELRRQSSSVANVLAGAGIIAPALTYGVWALSDMSEGIDLTGRPGITLTFLLLLTAPLFILGFGLLGRIVLAYLEEDERRANEARAKEAAPPPEQGRADRR